MPIKILRQDPLRLLSSTFASQLDFAESGNERRPFFSPSLLGRGKLEAVLVLDDRDLVATSLILSSVGMALWPT